MQSFLTETQRKFMVIGGDSQYYKKTNYVFTLKKIIKRLLKAMGQSVKVHSLMGLLNKDQQAAT